MAASSAAFWLRLKDGAARRIPAGGLLIGRSAGCDVLTTSRAASRRHAVVYLDEQGPSIQVLGRGGVSVAGESVEGRAELPDGSLVEVADLSFVVFRESIGEAEPPLWVFEGPGGGLFPVSRYPFTVGGGSDDALRLDGWPPATLTFFATRRGLEVRGAVALDKGTLRVEAGERARVEAGEIITVEHGSLKVVTGGVIDDGSTLLQTAGAPGAISARLEFLPRGGRLHIETEVADGSVYLPDRRCDLVAVLLQPPGTLVPGDFVVDELVYKGVWGKKPAGKRTLHVLVHRVRKDLDRAGVDGAALIERFEGGGSTRVVLAPDARVRIE